MSKVPIVFWSILFMFLLSSCNSYMKPEKARLEIQDYLDKNYNGLFRIDNIDKLYAIDLYKHQIGFKVWLVDTGNIRFGPVCFEKNEYQHGWITFYGSDLPKDYRAAQNKINKAVN